MNPTFKRDIERVFFTDFSEKINFCGIRLNAVITKWHSNPKLTGKFMENLDANTIMRYGKKVSIKSRDFPLPLRTGKNVTIDKEEYQILDIEYRFGVIHLYLQNFTQTGKKR